MISCNTRVLFCAPPEDSKGVRAVWVLVIVSFSGTTAHESILKAKLQESSTRKVLEGTRGPPRYMSTKAPSPALGLVPVIVHWK